MPTIALLLDIPPFRESDYDPGFYCVAKEFTDSYTLYKSIDGGVEWFSVGGSDVAGVMGEALTELPSATAGEWDETSVLQVTCDAPLGSYCSHNARLILVGDEIIRYRTASLVSEIDGVYTYDLSGLLRGLRYTEDEVVTHAVGDRFVLLNSAVIRIAQELEDIGIEALYRAVSYGATLSEEIEITFTHTGRGMQGMGGGDPSDTVEALDGTESAGVSEEYSRGDHKHSDALRHTHDNKSQLDLVSDGDHDIRSDNPHTVTKSQIGLDAVDNIQQLPMSYLDTTTTLEANSDVKVASQHAVKSYVDNRIFGGGAVASVLTNCTSNRSLRTVYQNTTGHILFVMVDAYPSGSYWFRGRIGATNVPNIPMFCFYGSPEIAMIMPVPPDYYYVVGYTNSGGAYIVNGTLAGWWEWY